jgi:hypothetical protein
LTLGLLTSRTIRPGYRAQVVECLPSKCEVLSSNPSTEQEQEEEEEEEEEELYDNKFVISH